MLRDKKDPLHKYGIMKILGKKVAAHRISYELFKGKIKKGKFILHHCDNPPCVNPSHLYQGTPQDNMTDKVKRGRQYHPVGIKNKMSKLKEFEVVEIKKMIANKIKPKIIGLKFKVHKNTIEDIKKGFTWNHVIVS